eukprot:TRINITY_DN928_c0_g3_i1.p1 TRINITY_DN928_c0_g3~~TRINITY_DN928_c0_g3_i1.p1  ORF type:complete len:751 (-),score=190.42 TRINITY_DN928_c0_g3_i1:50-2302(-)
MVTAIATTKEVSAGHVNIHPWEQFIHSFRTQVTSIHHNVSAALAETFCSTWQPTTAEPIWLLGRHYRIPARCSPDVFTLTGGPEEEAVQLAVPSADADASPDRSDESPCSVCAEGILPPDAVCGSPEEFEVAWAQITRMTYRKGFTPMYRCVRTATSAGPVASRRYIRLTSDAGWGCMIRVGQMLLATALKRHDHLSESTGEQPVERRFLDDPSAERSPFSIFEFIRAAHGREVVVPPGEEEVSGDRSCGYGSQAVVAGGGFGGRQLTQKLPGDWFGPTTISETIAALVERNENLRESLAVYVDSDGVLYEDEVRALAEGEEAVQRWRQALPPSPSIGVSSWKPSEKAADESEEEFMVLSTASVSSASNAVSPLLIAGPGGSPQLVHLAGAEEVDFEEARAQGADVMQVGSFKEALQMEIETLEFELPPAAIDSVDTSGGSAGQDMTDCESDICGGASASRPAEPSDSSSRWNRAVLLLFPLQLGCEKYVGEDRVSAVLRYFEIQSSLGAMGGRPRMAHFFVGRQGPGLLYVDPHVVQPAVSGCSGPGSEHPGGFEGAETFRNLPKVQVIPVEHIDSSISFAFYVRCEAELLELMAALRRIEAAEATAPIRVEATRPVALRQPQAVGLWGTGIGDLVQFEEEEVEPSECLQEARDPSLQVTRELPGTRLDEEGEEEEEEDDLGWRRSEAWDELKVPQVPRHELIFSDSEPVPDACSVSGGRTICLGSSWADGAWAQVQVDSCGDKAAASA